MSSADVAGFTALSFVAVYHRRSESEPQAELNGSRLADRRHLTECGRGIRRVRARTPLPAANARLTRRLTLKRSGRSPSFRSMNAQFTIGLPAVPCTVVTPAVRLSGRAEYDCSTPLDWKPWLIRSQTGVAGVIGEWMEP